MDDSAPNLPNPPAERGDGQTVSHVQKAQRCISASFDDSRALSDLKWAQYKAGNSSSACLLDDAIEAIQAAACGEAESSDDTELLFDLGFRLGARFELKGNTADLNRAVSVLRRVDELKSDDSPCAAQKLHDLNASADVCLHCMGRRGDLHGAVVASRLAVELVSDSDPTKPAVLRRYSNALTARFRQYGNLDDIHRALLAQSRGIELVPDEHPDKSSYLTDLGSSFYSRFCQTKEPEYLEQAVMYHGRAVELAPDGHPDMGWCLTNLGNSTHLRSRRTGKLEDLEQAVAFQRRAVDLIPKNDPWESVWYANLANTLLDLFDFTGKLEELDDVIAAHRRALDRTPDNHPSKPSSYRTLGELLLARFERTGKLEDLEQTILHQVRAVDLVPDDHPDKPECLNALGHSLRERFSCTGKLEDIDQSISVHRRSINLMPDGRIRPDYFSNLGSSLYRRYFCTGELEDLEQAIIANRHATDIQQDVPPHLTNLGNSLLTRFKHGSDREDVEQAISAHRRAADLTPDGHMEKSGQLNSLGNSLYARFGLTGELEDLQQALSARRRAVELVPAGHTSEPQYLHNLGRSYFAYFHHTTEHEHLEKAISAYRRAVDLAHPGHPHLSMWFHDLSIALKQRFHCVQTQSSFDDAVQAFTDSAMQPWLGGVSQRLGSAAHCVDMLSSYPAFSSTESLLSAHSRIIDLLPESVWLGYGMHRRFEESAKFGNLVTSAVSAAIAAGSLEHAAEWLEAGRALIWSQVLSLRTPLDELREAHCELAESFQDIQRQLQTTAHTSFSHDSYILSDVPGMVINAGLDEHRQLALKHNALLKEIRGCTGFQDFLRPRSFPSLMPSHEFADFGPVVFLNVDAARCDALGILPGGAITLIPLPDLSLERAQQLRSLWIKQLDACSIRQRESRTRGALQLAANPQSHPLRHSSLVQEDDPLDYLPALMWEWIVSPVLKALEIPSPTSQGGHLPHVTWCPTGPLTQLPLHTAGIYSDPNGPRTFNLIVSSYTPSLSALRRSYEGAIKPEAVPNALIVTQPASPGHTRIPKTTAEGACVANIMRDSQLASTLLNHDQATVSSVESIISQFPWVHLACHGSQHSGDASKSAFALYDGPLSLSDLMRTVADDAELAFLSACQTATGDAGNPEESVHLAAGMLAVGFKGVVATMWSIMDEDAPVVVEAYYKKLIELRSGAGKGGKGQTGAAYALHEAVAQLRAQVGEENFGRWAPFVHFGV